VSHLTFAQNTTIFPDSVKKGRVLALGITGAAVYTGGMAILYNQWYSKSTQTGFHWFNDNGEWLQMDKAGHIYSGYTESRAAYGLLRWTGLRDEKAIWYAAGTGLLMQTSIEVFDAFSAKWGFSWGDITANFIGVGAFAAQQKIWGEQKITFKVSSDFRTYPALLVSSIYPGEEPDLLNRRTNDLFGNSVLSSLLKDYNAQTNWISFNIASFCPERPSWLPRWLNISLGYSAENMFGGFTNEWEYQSKKYVLNPAQYPRYRQFLISPDIDWTRIRTRSPWVKALFFGLNMIKLPLPTLEVTSQGNAHWHWLYF
jgi:hypothetical protein